MIKKEKVMMKYKEKKGIYLLTAMIICAVVCAFAKGKKSPELDQGYHVVNLKKRSEMEVSGKGHFIYKDNTLPLKDNTTIISFTEVLHKTHDKLPNGDYLTAINDAVILHESRDREKRMIIKKIPAGYGTLTTKKGDKIFYQFSEELVFSCPVNKKKVCIMNSDRLKGKIIGGTGSFKGIEGYYEVIENSKGDVKHQLRYKGVEEKKKKSS